MTDRPAHGPQARDPYQRLDRVVPALSDALDGILDVEAGLREILVVSHHDTAVAGLGSVLDAEAGLAAILPPVPPEGPARTPRDTVRTEVLLRTIEPQDRLALRNEPEVRTAGRLLARTRGEAYVLRQEPPHRAELARRLALDLALDLTHGLALDLADALDLARDLSITAAQDLDLSRAADVAASLGRVAAFGAHRRRLADLIRDEELATLIDLAHGRATGLTRELGRDRGIALTFRLDVADDLDLVLDIVHGRARDLDRLLGFETGADQDVPHGDFLDLVLDIRTAEICRAVGGALGRKPPTLDGDSLHALLDDFVTADLRNADLAGIDLTGVYWSERGTRWPPGLDVGALKDRSDETFPGGGTWVVRSGTATIHDLAER